MMGKGMRPTYPTSHSQVVWAPDPKLSAEDRAWCAERAREIRALKAQEVGAAVGTRPAEYKPYDNEIPEKLYIRARQTGLRDFFSAPKDAP